MSKPSKLVIINIEIIQSATYFCLKLYALAKKMVFFRIIIVHDFDYIFFIAVTFFCLLSSLSFSLNDILSIGRASFFLILPSLTCFLYFFSAFLKACNWLVGNKLICVCAKTKSFFLLSRLFITKVDIHFK